MSPGKVSVPVLARLEGEAALDLKLRGGRVTDLTLRVYEPPRLFEPILVGRDMRDAPDITARICGICPVAHLVSSCNALESACGATIPAEMRDLRRLLYCGEWIESHVLHAFLLHAPDFLGLDDVLQIARTHRELVEKALRLKKLGNDIVAAVGGREIHPINVKVGGFYRVPAAAGLKALLPEIEWGCDAAEELALFTGTLPFPDFEQPYAFAALRDPDRYAIEDGLVATSFGPTFPPSEYEARFREEHVGHSNALHSVTASGEPYQVGPLARYTLNSAQLGDRCLSAAAAAGLGPECRNPYRSITVRMVEVLYACLEARRLVAAYVEPKHPSVAVHPAAGTGCGCSEAPRGVLYHRYRIDGRGRIESVQLRPPTAQNLRTIESDLRALAPTLADSPPAILARQCENAVRNYDPCISCATHFLTVRVHRE